jgi:hypothetical protein
MARANSLQRSSTELCPICLQSGEVGKEMVTLRCEFSSWAHESCLGKSVFETGGVQLAEQPNPPTSFRTRLARRGTYLKVAHTILHETFSTEHH